MPSKDLKPVYQAVNADAALAALDDLETKWGARYPAIIRLWRNAWAEFVPFLDYDVEIRKVMLNQRDLGVWIQMPVEALLPRQVLAVAGPDSERD